MRSEAPPLLPIFRSRHQAELLTILYLHPAREYTATDLAQRLDAPLSTIHNETQRLEQAGLLEARAVGRSRLLRADMANRISEPLAQILLLTFGPQVVVAEAFETVHDIDLVLIYGSWAARYEGTPGPPPNDVDVLVVGRVNRTSLYEAADRAEQRLGVPVNPTLCSPERWRDSDDPLIQQIRSSPTVVALDRRAAESTA
jgi:DNA-binding transcriptional ArsR family regulator